MSNVAPEHAEVFTGQTLDQAKTYHASIGKGWCYHRIDTRSGLTKCGKTPSMVWAIDDSYPYSTCHRCEKIKY